MAPADSFDPPCAERLKAARLRAGLTQSALGRQMRISPAWISHLENGNRLPSAGMLVRLADALGVSTDYLLGRTKRPAAMGKDQRLSPGDNELLELLRACLLRRAARRRQGRARRSS